MGMGTAVQIWKFLFFFEMEKGLLIGSSLNDDGLS